MAEQLKDGRGENNYLAVEVDGSLKINTLNLSGTNIDDFTLRFTQRIDYEDQFQPIYIGLALPGTSSGSAGWFIRKHTISGGMVTEVLFGSGNNNFDKIWDNRSGGIYS